MLCGPAFALGTGRGAGPRALLDVIARRISGMTSYITPSIEQQVPGVHAVGAGMQYSQRVQGTGQSSL